MEMAIGIVGFLAFLGIIFGHETAEKLVDEWRLERRHRRKLREIEARRDAKLLDQVFVDDDKEPR